MTIRNRSTKNSQYSDGRKIIIPTRRLSEATIVNFQRSRNHVINISVNIGFRASLKDISDLRQTVADYIKAHSKVMPGISCSLKVLIANLVVQWRTLLRAQKYRGPNKNAGRFLD
jgi:small-conductance mechanosensitive channel